VLTIANDELKNFMSKLLKEETFDKFEIRSAEILMHFGIEINGLLNKSLLAEDSANAKRNYVFWEEVRPLIFSFIKGKVKPKTIKIVFSLTNEELENLHKNAAACFINILFENDSVMITTAASEKTFSLDKSVIGCFDDFVVKFFKESGIAYETVDL
jgi:hypothetical protein